MDTTSLSAARTRASAFADSLYDGDVIDQTSGFTVDDLRELIAAAASDEADAPTVEDALQDRLGDMA